MYHRILTAVDESLNAHAAARYAIAVAQACGAALFVAGVLTPTMTDAEEGAMAQSAGSLVSEAGERGMLVHLLIERGDVAPTLNALVRTHHIDVVITASRRHDVEQRYFLRTVPQRLMSVLDCSLIIIRVVHLGLLAHPRQILVPVLGGAFDHAERAYLVSQLVAHFHAKLVVFHALEEARQRGQAVPYEAGARQVRMFVDSLREAGTEPEIRIVTGPLVGEAIMQEAVRRFGEFGPNELSPSRRISLGRKLLRQFTHFLALLLWIAACLAYLASSLQPGEGMEMLAHAIVAVIVINAFFSFFQEYKAERASAALHRLLPDRVKVRRGGEVAEVHAREVVPGDLLLVGEGDRIPADSRMVEVTFLKVDNAPLTGESEPQARVMDADEAQALFEARNIVFAGTTVFSGSGRAVVFATGDATEFGKVARMTQEVPLHISPLQLEIRRVTRVVTVISVIMGLSFFVLGHVVGRTFWENFIFAIGILVANVPEGLLPTVTLSLSMASQRMARRNALVKDLPAVEALGSTTVICTDKTGTLTQNRMAVRAIFSGGQLFQWPAHPAVEENPFFWLICRLCNNASLEGEKALGDPLEVALLQAAAHLGESGLAAYLRLYEVPFDPERKRMTTVHRLPQGTTAVLTKGAVENLLPLCSAVLAREGTVPLAPHQREEILEVANGMAGSALRVLAFAYQEVASTSTAFSPEALEQDLRQKLRIVTVLKDMGEIVAVTGDGVNDGPALKHADIRIAMGVTGTDVAREAAQMVLLDDNFATIVAAIEESRTVFENIRKFLTYILTSNIPEIVPYLAFVLFGIPLPLTIIQILAIDLGTAALPLHAWLVALPFALIPIRGRRRT